MMAVKGMRRNERTDVENASTGRSLTRSLAHFLFRSQLSCLVLEHDRYVVPDGKREPVGLADELRLPRTVDERPLAEGADKDVKQARVHECVPE